MARDDAPASRSHSQRCVFPPRGTRRASRGVSRERRSSCAARSRYIGWRVGGVPPARRRGDCSVLAPSAISCRCLPDAPLIVDAAPLLVSSRMAANNTAQDYVSHAPECAARGAAHGVVIYAYPSAARKALQRPRDRHNYCISTAMTPGNAASSEMV